MNSFDAHAILNAAQAGAPVSAAEIMAALKATGDLNPIKRTDNLPIEITHAVPHFAPCNPTPPSDADMKPRNPPKGPKPDPSAKRYSMQDDEQLIQRHADRRTYRVGFGALPTGPAPSVWAYAQQVAT